MSSLSCSSLSTFATSSHPSSVLFILRSQLSSAELRSRVEARTDASEEVREFELRSRTARGEEGERSTTERAEMDSEPRLPQRESGAAVR